MLKPFLGGFVGGWGVGVGGVGGGLINKFRFRSLPSVPNHDCGRGCIMQTLVTFCKFSSDIGRCISYIALNTRVVQVSIH